MTFTALLAIVIKWLGGKVIFHKLLFHYLTHCSLSKLCHSHRSANVYLRTSLFIFLSKQPPTHTHAASGELSWLNMAAHIVTVKSLFWGMIWISPCSVFESSVSPLHASRHPARYRAAWNISIKCSHLNTGLSELRFFRVCVIKAAFIAASTCLRHLTKSPTWLLLPLIGEVRLRQAGHCH